MDSTRENAREPTEIGFGSDLAEQTIHRRLCNAEPPLLLGGHTVLPSNDSTVFNPSAQRGTPKTEVSLVVDGGDTKQLEQAGSLSETPKLPTEDVSHTVSGAGEIFSDVLLPRGSFVLEFEDLPQSSEQGAQQSLEGRIRDAMEESSWTNQGKIFLPTSERNKIINKATIKAELGLLNIGSEEELLDTTEKIWGISTFKLLHTLASTQEYKTTRRKLFTILLLMTEVEKILDLINEGIHDSDLPFVFETDSQRAPRQLQRKLKDGMHKTIQSFISWKPNVRDQFEEYQWKMLAPFWELSNEKDPLVRHYRLEERIILPFIDFPISEVEGSDIEHVGGFSEVRKVKIHAAHHNLHAPHPHQDENRFFAVKKLNKSPLSKNFDTETKNLKRFVDKNHDHLIRLLVTFQHGRDYHLVFPWADGNLMQYWKKRHPGGSCLLRDVNTAQWLAKQLKGLASGVQLIHKCTVDGDNGKTLAVEKDQIYGRHGDLKPENILWFKDDDKGILQIADFGLADFHRRGSYKVRASRAGRSSTYRAPECDADLVSPSSDMWSFGCILLEFVAWYLLGWDEIDYFEEKRTLEENQAYGEYAEDKFFVNSGLERKDSKGQLCARIKDSVIQEILKLRQHKECSDFLRKVLDVIQDGLLQVQPKERKGCVQIFENFEAIYRRCLDDPEYCISTPSSPTLPETNESPTAGSLRTANTMLSLAGDTSDILKRPISPRESNFEQSHIDDSNSDSHLPQDTPAYVANQQDNPSNIEVESATDTNLESQSPIPDPTTDGGGHSPSPKGYKSRGCFSLRRLRSRIFNFIVLCFRSLWWKSCMSGQNGQQGSAYSGVL
ncbi:kinase-like domain-containing protein [Dactylonectria estremocensis]|uniref:Kinase-like domain-containing protein n=1 Tax=Dactylonectria estremocensis TaxID=1079267 RepID=A0A9P9FJY2_9HYPO|nr:kinase-like domain-containing protein [Dactylonectria estremocensis]